MSNAALGGLGYTESLNDGLAWTVSVAVTDLYNSANGSVVKFTQMSVGVGQSFTLSGGAVGGNPSPGAAGPTTLTGTDTTPGTTYSTSLTVATGTSSQQGTYTQSGNTITVVIPANVASSGTMTATIQYTIVG